MTRCRSPGSIPAVGQAAMRFDPRESPAWGHMAMKITTALVSARACSFLVPIVIVTVVKNLPDADVTTPGDVRDPVGRFLSDLPHDCTALSAARQMASGAVAPRAQNFLPWSHAGG